LYCKSDWNLTIACFVDKTNEFDVFISYCWAQKDIVRQIATQLRIQGFQIWLDIEQMCTYQFDLLFHGTAHIMLNSDRKLVDVMLGTTVQRSAVCNS